MAVGERPSEKCRTLLHTHTRTCVCGALCGLCAAPPRVRKQWPGPEGSLSALGPSSLHWPRHCDERVWGGAPMRPFRGCRREADQRHRGARDGRGCGATRWRAPAGPIGAVPDAERRTRRPPVPSDRSRAPAGARPLSATGPPAAVDPQLPSVRRQPPSLEWQPPSVDRMPPPITSGRS